MTTDWETMKRVPAPTVQDVACTAWHRPDPGGPLVVAVGGIRPGSRARYIRATAAVGDPENPCRLLLSTGGTEPPVVVQTVDLRTEGDLVVVSMLLCRTRRFDLGQREVVS